MMTETLDWLDKHLVSEARDWWKLWSIRLNAVGAAILAWVTFDPVSVLAVWNMMPASLREVIPANAFQFAALVLFGLGMLARFIKQPKVTHDKPES
jgi:hypothetical protein